MRILHLDFESYCEADIRKVGLENYVNHPSFAVTCLAWAFDDEPVQAKAWPDTAILPGEIVAHIEDGGEIRAHNAGFEFAVLVDNYGLPVEPEQMNCTMQRALAYGLPAGLLKAGIAGRARIVKDETKRLLMLQMGRPRKGSLPWHETDRAKLMALVEYCRNDVAAERSLDAVVPELHPWERELSVLDAQINRKGVLLDRAAVDTLRAAAGTALLEIDAECATLTGGAVTSPGTQTAKLLAWLQVNSCPLPDVAKETIEKALSGPHLPTACWMTVRRVLELRQMAARSSLAKLDRMQDVASKADGRARHLLQFYGAGRTGRWAGRLVQPQNLPRTGDIDAEQVIGAASLDLGAPGLLWGDALGAISKSLRSCFVAKPGHVLVSVDLSQIEARVLAWMAGQSDVLDAFRAGQDVYVLAAAKVGSQNRQLGKVLTLACGFGMGWVKFQETAAAAPYHIELTAAEAKRHLYAWRDANPKVTALWAEAERTVRASISTPGVVLDLPGTMHVRTRNGVCQIRKPNGVKLSYHNMRLSQGDLIFDGVNSTTKNWGREKAYGGRLVENWVQSVARDVMAEGMLAVTEVPVMTVHDEIVWELPDDGSDYRELKPVAPGWAAGLPVASALHVGVRYAK